MYRAESPGPLVERDFEWMARWKFDFVRLPMDYRAWADPKDPRRTNEKVLAWIDQAIEWGKRYGIHVNLNRPPRARPEVLRGRPVRT